LGCGGSAAAFATQISSPTIRLCRLAQPGIHCHPERSEGPASKAVALFLVYVVILRCEPARNSILDAVGKYDNMSLGMIRNTRPISWINAARKEFQEFPDEVQVCCLTALTVAAEGGKADIAKPLHGFGSGIFEIALPYRGSFALSMPCRSEPIYGCSTVSRRNRLTVSRRLDTKSI
jgi:hypothetical protein